jgi:hypothetical protein
MGDITIRPSRAVGTSQFMTTPAPKYTNDQQLMPSTVGEITLRQSRAVTTSKFMTTPAPNTSTMNA